MISTSGSPSAITTLRDGDSTPKRRKNETNDVLFLVVVVVAAAAVVVVVVFLSGIHYSRLAPAFFNEYRKALVEDSVKLQWISLGFTGSRSSRCWNFHRHFSGF